MELIEILHRHAKSYPLMQPCDAVKLIYQNEFGGGHIIKDPKQSLLYLRREYEQTEKTPDAPLYEDIGNGIVRVNLSALDTEIYSLDDLNRDFVSSANRHKGDPKSFEQKLKLMLSEFDRIGFGFTKDELEKYLDDYLKAGCPPVSHSEAYRNAYKPAYRIIEKL